MLGQMEITTYVCAADVQNIREPTVTTLGVWVWVWCCIQKKNKEEQCPRSFVFAPTCFQRTVWYKQHVSNVDIFFDVNMYRIHIHILYDIHIIYHYIIYIIYTMLPCTSIMSKTCHTSHLSQLSPLIRCMLKPWNGPTAWPSNSISLFIQ